jgi:prevent-host-death family protein
MDTPWQLQDAKTHFSELVDAALEGKPQHVTRRGKSAVVVVSAEDYDRLQRGARSGAPGFIEHLLAVPKSKPSRRKGTRPAVCGPRLRDIDFE